MFGFFKSKPAPARCDANPGICIETEAGFATGDRSWSEKVNVVRLAASAFKMNNHSVKDEKTWLHHGASGFMISPQFVEFVPLDGGVRTTTTIQINHATLAPGGVFEYQHATGTSLGDSISKGFDLWMQTDFVALLEALRSEPESCMTLKMSFPAKDSKPRLVRRAIFGPVAHLTNGPPKKAEAATPEEHPFCPCCLLTRSTEAFKDLIEGDAFYGLRLFAARDAEGQPQADCRVNGVDWEKGAQALRDYAATWPATAGYEFRKQYVVLQTIQA